VAANAFGLLAEDQNLLGKALVDFIGAATVSATSGQTVIALPLFGGFTGAPSGSGAGASIRDSGNEAWLAVTRALIPIHTTIKAESNARNKIRR